MEHILSLSYGKDSLACLGAIKELGLPLDRIIHAEIWAAKNIPADLPPMVEFKEKADRIIKERYGLTVEHITADYTYEEIFYRKTKRGKHIGQIYGFPLPHGNWCNNLLKVNTLYKRNKDSIQYVGIAYDEPKRFKILNELRISPLVSAKWTEKMCHDWCFENDLLSPIYTTSSRGGCWFCHNQSIGHLRLLRRNYPEYWNLLLKWDIDSPISFKPSHTVHDFEERFRLEDEGIIFPNDNSFKWKWLNSDIQLKFFS